MKYVRPHHLTSQQSPSMSMHVFYIKCLLLYFSWNIRNYAYLHKKWVYSKVFNWNKPMLSFINRLHKLGNYRLTSIICSLIFVTDSIYKRKDLSFRFYFQLSSLQNVKSHNEVLLPPNLWLGDAFGPLDHIGEKTLLWGHRIYQRIAI